VAPAEWGIWKSGRVKADGDATSRAIAGLGILHRAQENRVASHCRVARGRDHYFRFSAFVQLSTTVSGGESSSVI
jgi:hypothetical protein